MLIILHPSDGGHDNVVEADAGKDIVTNVVSNLTDDKSMSDLCFVLAFYLLFTLCIKHFRSNNI